MDELVDNFNLSLCKLSKRELRLENISFSVEIGVFSLKHRVFKNLFAPSKEFDASHVGDVFKA